MAINYTALAATVSRLLDENGRDMVLVRSADAPPDAAKPWNVANLADAGVVVATVKAVEDSAMSDQRRKSAALSLNKPGTEPKNVKSFIIAAQGLAEPITIRHRLRETTESNDLSRPIVHVDVVNPGSTVVLYQCEVEQ
jgi:hypothetical protein